MTDHRPPKTKQVMCQACGDPWPCSAYIVATLDAAGWVPPWAVSPRSVDPVEYGCGHTTVRGHPSRIGHDIVDRCSATYLGLAALKAHRQVMHGIIDNDTDADHPHCAECRHVWVAHSTEGCVITACTCRSRWPGAAAMEGIREGIRQNDSASAAAVTEAMRVTTRRHRLSGRGESEDNAHG